MAEFSEKFAIFHPIRANSVTTVSTALGADRRPNAGQSRLQYLRYELAHCILIADNIGPRLWFECDRQPANTLKFASLML